MKKPDCWLRLLIAMRSPPRFCACWMTRGCARNSPRVGTNWCGTASPQKPWHAPTFNCTNPFPAGTMATTLSNQSPASSSQEETRARAIKVFMMDLWSTVPYYDAYLCQALRSENVSVHLGAITYYLDPDCFSMRGIRNRPGLL